MPFRQNVAQYLRIIVTNRCNLNCYYCHKEGNKDIDLNELSAEKIILLSKMSYDIGIRKFKLMGGEPTLRKDLPYIIKGIRGFSDDVDISIITNGVLVKELTEKYIEAGINRFNISIHGWQPKRYEKITRVSSSYLNKTKESIEYLISKEMLSKVNYLFLKGKNEEELLEVIKWTSRYNLKLDILNVLYDSKSKDELKSLYYSFDEILDFISKNFSIKDIKLNQNRFSLPSTNVYLTNGGVLNLKSTALNKEMVFKSCKTCPEFEYCKEGIKAIRLNNNGMIKPCLFRDDNSFDINSYLDENNYEDTLEKFYHYIKTL